MHSEACIRVPASLSRQRRYCSSNAIARWTALHMIEGLVRHTSTCMQGLVRHEWQCKDC